MGGRAVSRGRCAHFDRACCGVLQGRREMRSSMRVCGRHGHTPRHATPRQRASARRVHGDEMSADTRQRRGVGVHCRFRTQRGLVTLVFILDVIIDDVRLSPDTASNGVFLSSPSPSPRLDAPLSARCSPRIQLSRKGGRPKGTRLDPKTPRVRRAAARRLHKVLLLRAPHRRPRIPCGAGRVCPR